MVFSFFGKINIYGGYALYDIGSMPENIDMCVCVCVVFRPALVFCLFPQK